MGQIKTTHAGHGGKKTNGRWADPGAIGNGYQETDIARQINAKIIKATGALDATDNAGTSVNGNLANIVAKMNSVGTDWHISNHLNSASPGATGVEVWYWSGDATSKAKAEQLSKALADALGIVNRGAKPTKDFYVLRNSKGRTLLIEWAFISNANDVKHLLANMDKGVNALLKVFGYSNAKPSTPTPAPKPKPTPAPSNLKGSDLPNSGYYTVTVGTNIRSSASTGSAIVGSYNKGQGFNYDSKVTAGGYVWLSYISYSGVRRYVAVV